MAYETDQLGSIWSRIVNRDYRRLIYTELTRNYGVLEKIKHYSWCSYP
jgi:hypothetical protein